MNSVEI